MNDRPTDKPLPHRRLSAVMFTDMVGYSSLTQENEALAMELLEEHREIVRAIVPNHDGREINTAGDAFFILYESALEATQAAIEIQQTLHDRNRKTDDQHAIVLRIGLHLGDVIHVGDQVQGGDGVNIAARMEPLARPGSICVSEDVARQVHNKIDLPLASLGRKQLKNIHLPMDAYRIVMPWEDDYDASKASPAFSRPAQRGRGRPGNFLVGAGRRRWSYVAGIFVAAVAVVAVGAILWFDVGTGRGSGPTSPGEAQESVVAVLPFSVQGNPEFDYLGRGMVDLLSTKLDGAGKLRAVDPRAVLGAVEQFQARTFDPERGREIANRLNAGSFVLGNIVEIGGRLRIDAAVYSAGSSTPTKQGTVEGLVTDIFDLIDGLATQLLILDRTGPGAPVERLEQMTTSSFDALKHYLQGVDAFRAARFRMAAEELTLAVELDSAFALAWYQLSSTADWLFDVELSLHAAEQSLRHKDNMSDRGRRLVEALHAGKVGRNREALRLYRDFLTRYPDDVEAWYQLGELQFHAGHLLGFHADESLTAWNRLLYFEPDQITALIHSARLGFAAGDFAKADSIVARIFELEPAAERNIEFRAHLALKNVGDTPTGSVASQLRAADDDMLAEVIWSLGAFRDNPSFAASVTPFLTDPQRSDEARGLGFVLDGYLLTARGRLVEARQAFDRAADVGYGAVPEHRSLLTILPFRDPPRGEIEATLMDLRQWDAGAVPNAERRSIWYSLHDEIHDDLKYYLIGILEAMTGNYEAAQRAALHLDESEVKPGMGSIVSDLAIAVRAEIVRRRGDYLAAEELLNQAELRMLYQYTITSSFASQSRERFILAQLLEDRGELDAAISAMSLFSDYSVFDLIYSAPSHLRRAVMYDQLGDLKSAAEHYERFIILWADCDDEFRPALDNAKKRVSELQQTSRP